MLAFRSEVGDQSEEQGILAFACIGRGTTFKNWLVGPIAAELQPRQEPFGPLIFPGERDLVELLRCAGDETIFVVIVLGAGAEGNVIAKLEFGGSSDGDPIVAASARG